MGNLADAVALHKVKHISEQRRSIKKLGKRKLDRLILYIFSAIAAEEYNISQIASEYDLSKTALSRFAGSKWYKVKKDGKKIIIPDLWKNTAEILAKNLTYMETVINFGVVSRLEKILSLIQSQRDKKNG